MGCKSDSYYDLCYLLVLVEMILVSSLISGFVYTSFILDVNACFGFVRKLV